jgi:hypothetical protein
MRHGTAKTELQPVAAAGRASSQARLLEFAFALKHLGKSKI